MRSIVDRARELFCQIQQKRAEREAEEKKERSRRGFDWSRDDPKDFDHKFNGTEECIAEARVRIAEARAHLVREREQAQQMNESLRADIREARRFMGLNAEPHITLDTEPHITLNSDPVRPKNWVKVTLVDTNKPQLNPGQEEDE